MLLIEAAGQHTDDEVAASAPLLEHKLQMGQLEGAAGFGIRELGSMVSSLETARDYKAVMLYDKLSTIYEKTLNYMPRLNEKLERETATEI